MKPGMVIERGNYFEDSVIFTHCFDVSMDYNDFDFKLSFDLQELLNGDILFVVFDAVLPYNLLYESNISEALPVIEAIIESKSLIIRAILDISVEGRNVFRESVDTFILGAYQLDNLISIRDKILKIMNYGGGLNATSD